MRARVPGLFVSGENDKSYGTTTINWFNTWRATHGADVALIADWGMGHSGTSRDLIWTHIAQSIKERYPQGQLPTATAGVTLATVPTETSWLGQSNRVSSNALTPIDWPQIAPYSEYSGDASKASWLVNQTEALVYRAHNATSARVVDIVPAIGDGYHLEVYQVGQEITMQLFFMGDPSAITGVQVYHGDQLLVDCGEFLDAGSAALSYWAMDRGIHTFTAVVSYLRDGQQVYASDYWAAAVVPEPMSATTLVIGCMLILLRRRRLIHSSGRH